MRACVRARVRACVRARVRACVRARVRACVFVCETHILLDLMTSTPHAA